MPSHLDPPVTALTSQPRPGWSMRRRLLLVAASTVPLAFAAALEWIKGHDGIGTVAFESALVRNVNSPEDLGDEGTI